MSGRITTVSKPPKLERKKRVAAYARVSSGKDAMLHSLSAQVSHYSDLIQRNSDWLYAGVRASLTERCILPMNVSLATKRVRTADLPLWKAKRKLFS